MSKKRTTTEEKKGKLLQLFHEKADFFQFKDLEKLAKEEKGIAPNVLKDILQALVDEGNVETDKIGASIYYWSFPSKVRVAQKHKLETLKDTYEEHYKKLKISEKKLVYIKIQQNDGDKNKLLDKISDLELEKNELVKKVVEFQDQNKLYEQKLQIQTLKEAANRWTDNIFNIKSWCKKKFFLEDATLNKQFNIPSDMDYLE